MSGKSMDRPEWNKLYKKILANRIERLIVWRLDRLGRTASGLTKLIEEMNEHKVKFISVKEGMDLSTPAGRLIKAPKREPVDAYLRAVKKRLKGGVPAKNLVHLVIKELT